MEVYFKWCSFFCLGEAFFEVPLAKFVFEGTCGVDSWFRTSQTINKLMEINWKRCPIDSTNNKKHLESFVVTWLVLSDEQTSKRWPFSLLNDEQMSNWVGVKHLPVLLFITLGFSGAPHLVPWLDGIIELPSELVIFCWPRSHKNIVTDPLVLSFYFHHLILRNICKNKWNCLPRIFPVKFWWVRKWVVISPPPNLFTPNFGR